MDKEDLQVYPRITASLLPDNMNKYVSIVGRVNDVNGSNVILDCGDKTFITVEDITNLNKDNMVNIEVRGEVIGTALVKKHEYNAFGNADFDIETFNKVVTLARKNFNHLF